MKTFSLFVLLFFAADAMAQIVPRFGPPSSPERVIRDPPTGGVTSPTLSEDELELVFESLGNLWRATRTIATTPFENAIPITELNTTEFAEERPYFTPNGLGLYFTRSKSSPIPSRKVYLARRTSKTSPFLSPVEVGIAGVPYFNGSLGSVSEDGLTLYLDIVRPGASGSGIPNQTDIASSTRASASDQFGPWKFIDEVNTNNLERGPAISRDERTLFFSVQGVGISGFLFGSVRPDRTSPFGPPTLIQGINSSGVINKDPFIAFPGSRLYYIRNGELVFSNRIFEAEYQIGEGEGVTGRRVVVPISVRTAEADAILFEVPIFVNPNFLNFKRAIPPPELGLKSLVVTPISQGRNRIVYQSTKPLLGSGEFEKVLDLEFTIATNAPIASTPVGSGGTFRINRIDMATPSNGSVTIGTGPTYPPVSMWKLR